MVSLNKKVGCNLNNNAAGTTSVLIAAANAAAVKVRQRKTGRKTGVLYNCHIYPAAGPTNGDISEESSTCTDTSNGVATNGDTTSTTDSSSERQDNTSTNNSSSAVEDDYFDVHQHPPSPYRPPSPFQHSSGLDQITSRQIDKVINLFRPRQAVVTHEYTSNTYHPATASNIIVENQRNQRKSTSAKVKPQITSIITGN